MPRQPKCRRVGFIPHINVFKPQGVPLQNLKEIVLKVEELEAVRLKDHLNLEQEEAARMMHVSRPTFQRILSEARSKIANALTTGKAIRIEGGDYRLEYEYCKRFPNSINDAACMSDLKEINSNKKNRSDLMTKVAICSSGNTPSSMMDERLGRCQYFMIWDPEKLAFEAVTNNGIDAAHGAGTGAVQDLVKHGTKAVIANRVGPKAFTALQRSGIKIYSASNMTVLGALEKFQANELEEIGSPSN